MRLARVEHERCKENQATTFVWVDDEVTQEQFQAWADAARDAFLKAEADFAAEPPAKFPGYHFDVNKADPAMSVAEAQAEFTRLRDEHSAWEKRKAATKHEFAKYLVAAAGGRVVAFYERPADLKAQISWGHRHGTDINYSETDPTENDFNSRKDDDWL